MAPAVAVFPLPWEPPTKGLFTRTDTDTDIQTDKV